MRLRRRFRFGIPPVLSRQMFGEGLRSLRYTQVTSTVIKISTTHHPATDLGYLLHKNPGRVHDIDVTFGRCAVLFPEATEERCTVALLIEVDTIDLVRSPGGSLSQYVNDRPYVASSFLCSAINKAFGTAMSGRCKDRPDLAQVAIPLEVRLAVLGAKAGQEGIRRLFEPLGYSVWVEKLQLDPHFPEWGESDYYSVLLSGTVTIQSLLLQLYILLPVLDAKKHYYLDSQEVNKLITKGEGWLATHPEKAWIVRNFLGRKPSLIRDALEQLVNVEPDLAVVSLEDEVPPDVAERIEKKKSLHEQRHDRVIEVVRNLKPNSVVDLGCGDGKLLRNLVPILGLNRIVGMDVSYFELEKAAQRLRLENASPKMRERIELIHGSLMYRDQRLDGFDVATAVEVIEHLDVARLHAFERVVFECARPQTVIITTPNREYNAVYHAMDGLRHEDHRFEWTRAEFTEWSERVAGQYGYRVEIEGLGEAHESYGAPSQMGVFSR